jgi:hypothetical protein
MLYFLCRFALWMCVLSLATLVWASFFDAGHEGLPRSLERNFGLLVSRLVGG